MDAGELILVHCSFNQKNVRSKYSHTELKKNIETV